MYVGETRRDPKFLRIDCSDAAGQMLPPDAIFEKVRNTIDPFLR